MDKQWVKILLLGGVLMCQTPFAQAGPGGKIAKNIAQYTPRVKGANVTKYSQRAQHWAATYALNTRFLDEMSRIPPSVAFAVNNEDALHLSEGIKSHIFTGPDPALQSDLLAIQLNFDSKIEWLTEHESSWQENLRQVTGPETDFAFIQKLADSNLVFVGEIHGQVAPRLEFVNVIEKFRQFHPTRRVVVFFESLYLRPLEAEGAYPYPYYRRGVEGVEEPFDITDVNNPNYALMEQDSKYAEMLTRLSQQHVEMYPVEDAVVVQTLSAAGRIPTFEGLMERNKGFARTIREQMLHIRQTDPDALFIYYGGMAHGSWVMPGSLPKFFADETPVVVEIVSEQNMKTMSLAQSICGPDHTAFTPTGEKRLFLWGGPQAQSWGKNIGFDMRLVVP